MAQQPTRYTPSKEPFQYTSLNDFRFQTNDVVLTRVIKLEYLRKKLQDVVELPEPEPFPDIEQARYRFGAFWTFAFASGETMLLHTAADDLMIFRGFASSRGTVGVPPSDTMVCPIYRNPAFVGDKIVSGEQIGTMTIAATGAYSFSTVNDARVRIYKGDQIGVKAPVVDLGAKSGSFTFRVLLGFPKVGLLLSGDAQGTSMNDVIILEGDMTDGNDRLLLSGDVADDEEFPEDG